MKIQPRIIVYSIAILIVSMISLIFYFKPNKVFQSITQKTTLTTISKIKPKSTNAINVFHMPDTSWKTKTVHGLVYKFGEGNPSAIALKPSDYTGDGKWKDYVTPEVEKNLLIFLSNKNLENIVNKCSHVLGRDKIDPDNPLISNTAKVLDPAEISMEKMLYIDEKTGLKTISYERMISLGGLFEILNNTLADEKDRLFHRCLTDQDYDDFIELEKQYGAVTMRYINTPKGYSANDKKILMRHLYQFIKK